MRRLRNILLAMAMLATGFIAVMSISAPAAEACQPSPTQGHQCISPTNDPYHAYTYNFTGYHGYTAHGPVYYW